MEFPSHLQKKKNDACQASRSSARLDFARVGKGAATEPPYAFLLFAKPQYALTLIAGDSSFRS